MSCSGLVAQDRAATSPDGAGKDGLRRLLSLFLPPAKASCKTRLHLAARVPERRCEEKVLQREGLTEGVGMLCRMQKRPRFPHAPMDLAETPSRGPHAGAGEHLGSPLE